MGIKRKGLPDSMELHRPYPYFPGEDELAGGSWIPPVDIYETEESYILNAELPGLASEDIHVEVSASEVTIRGGRRADAACPEENFYRMEGMRGQFCRTFSLPEPLDNSDVRTSLRDGVLSVVIPKSARARKIPIRPPHTGQ